MFKYICPVCGGVIHVNNTPKPPLNIMRLNAYYYPFLNKNNEYEYHYACPLCLTPLDEEYSNIITNDDEQPLKYPHPVDSVNEQDAVEVIKYVRKTLEGVDAPEPELNGNYLGLFISLEVIKKQYGGVSSRRHAYALNFLNVNSSTKLNAPMILKSIKDYIRSYVNIKANSTIIELLLQVGEFKPTNILQPGFAYYINGINGVVTPWMLIQHRIDVERIISIINHSRRGAVILGAPVLDYYELTPGGVIALRRLHLNPKANVIKVNAK